MHKMEQKYKIGQNSLQLKNCRCVCGIDMIIIFQMMNGQQNSSAIEEIESDDSANLHDLRKKVELSNIKLHELTYNDEKFMNTIEELNLAGIKGIETEEYREALIYFHENEKILEYAASCGKTIDRSIIIVTLHNEACVHQKLWDLDRSVNYLEAILFNIKSYLDSTQPKTKKFSHQQQPSSPQPSQLQLEELLTYAQKKQKYALYQLQYCAVNSQLKKHDISVNSAKAAIKCMREVCKMRLKMGRLLAIWDESPFGGQCSRARDRDMLEELIEFDEDLELKNYDFYLQQVKKIIREKQQNSKVQEQFKHLKTFSIGRLMQITPISFSEYQRRPTFLEYFTYENQILKALYLAISYFTVGTQLRFISSESADTHHMDPKLSQEFLLSEVYHIYAILIVLRFVPIDTIFLNHLLTSFNNHYLIDLEKISLKEKKDKNLSPLEKRNQIEQEKQINLLPQQSEIKTPAQSVKKKKNEQERLHTGKSHSSSKKKSRAKESEKLIFYRNNSHSKEKYSVKKQKKVHREKLNTELYDTSRKQNTSKKKRKTLSKKDSGKKNVSVKKTKKYCIYTTRQQKDRNASSSPDFMKSSKSKSKSRSKKKMASRQFQRTSQAPFQSARLLLSDQNEKNLKNVIQRKRTSKSREKSKNADEYKKKLLQSNSKNKSRNIKEKIKMKKVQVSRLAASYSEYV